MQELDIQLDFAYVPYGLASEARVAIQLLRARDPAYLLYQIVLSKTAFGKNEALRAEFPQYYAAITTVYVLHLYLAAEQHVSVLFGAAECVLGQAVELYMAPYIVVRCILSVRQLPAGQEIYSAIRCVMRDSRLFYQQNALNQALFRAPRLLIGYNGYMASGAPTDGVTFFTLNHRLPLEIYLQAAIGNTFVVLATKYIDYMAVARSGGVETLSFSVYELADIPKEVYETADVFQNANGEVVINNYLKHNVFGIRFSNDKKQLRKVYDDVFKNNPKEVQKMIKKFNYKRLCKAVTELAGQLVFYASVALPFSGVAINNLKPFQHVAGYKNAAEAENTQVMLAHVLRHLPKDAFATGNIIFVIRSPGLYQIGNGAIILGGSIASVDVSSIYSIMATVSPILAAKSGAVFVFTDVLTKEEFVLSADEMFEFLERNRGGDCLFRIDGKSGYRLFIQAISTSIEQINVQSSQPRYDNQKTKERVDQAPVPAITDETIVIDEQEQQFYKQAIERLVSEQQTLKGELAKLQAFESDLLVNQYVLAETKYHVFKDLEVFPNVGSINLVKYYCGLEIVPPNTLSRLDLMQFLANSCSFKRLTYAVANMITEVTRICYEAARVKTLCGYVQSDLCLEQECLINYMENKLLYLQKLELRNQYVIDYYRKTLMGPYDACIAQATSDVLALKYRAKSKPPSVLAPLRSGSPQREADDVMSQIKQMMK